MSRLLRAALFLVVSAPAASAQGRTSPAVADSSAARIMARVGSRTDAVWLRDLLRQADAQHPQATLDEVTDSLVARAVDPAAAQRESEANTRAVHAVLALLNAGSTRGVRGRSYAGAFDKLVMVHRQAASPDVRQRALAGMLVSSHSRAVAYLRQVAESSDSSAFDAVDLLVSDADGGSLAAITPTAAERQESVSALKALASGGRVDDRRAATTLEFWMRRPQ